ncbi:MAG: DUF378 domain-containing protein [Neisseriaceae bacterium]|jgi:uncharacterized membrane protein YuzA (DUF378 family)
MKQLKFISLILIIVGGLNWGLVGLFNFNLVSFIFGKIPAVENIVYILVGIAALISIAVAKDCCAKGACKK